MWIIFLETDKDGFWIRELELISEEWFIVIFVEIDRNLLSILFKKKKITGENGINFPEMIYFIIKIYK